MIASVTPSVKRNRIRHHPDVATFAVEVWFTPVSILVQYVDAVLVDHYVVVGLI